MNCNPSSCNPELLGTATSTACATSRTWHRHQLRQTRERGPRCPRRLAVPDCGNPRSAHGRLDHQRLGRGGGEGCQRVRGEAADGGAGTSGEQIQDAVDAWHLKKGQEAGLRFEIWMVGDRLRVGVGVEVSPRDKVMVGECQV